MPTAHVPLIGLTTYRQHATWGSWDREAAVLQTSYIDCVAVAGGRPLLLPPGIGLGVAGDSAASVADRLDGLVVVGGADVEPSRYGAERRPETEITHPWRDDNEIRLVDAFLEAGKPVLGVCRGAQILNTVFGGTLNQHVPDTLGHTVHQPGPGQFGETKVRAVRGSKVAEAMGGSFSVLCSHHQAIERLGAGLVVTAQSEDGDVIEAVELKEPGAGFVVGVQWHPEQSEDTRLFRALVDAC